MATFLVVAGMLVSSSPAGKPRSCSPGSLYEYTDSALASLDKVEHARRHGLTRYGRGRDRHSSRPRA